MKYSLMQSFIRLVNWLASRYATEILWTFDEPMAVGKIQLIRSSYGAYLNFPELYGLDNAVLMADLYYRTEEGREIDPDQPYSVQVWAGDNLNGSPVFQQSYRSPTETELVTEA